ncbi:hypothetical protein F5I97DRAFT_1832814 [Phlebopus sp. FC_14]|nr:hypothetical protein F5I97DRAFT_1832814 [Phlebopus sp. FC_14]
MALPVGSGHVLVVVIDIFGALLKLTTQERASKAQTSTGGHKQGGQRGGGMFPTDAASPDHILWTDKHAPRTTHLIAYCKDNDDFPCKLFLGSTQDVNAEGRTRVQMSTTKDSYYLQVTQLIFSHDHNPKIREVFQANPLAFVKPIEHHFHLDQLIKCFRLCKKYMEINAKLGALGAGLNIEDLRRNPQWEDLHGWWKNNPKFKVLGDGWTPDANEEDEDNFQKFGGYEFRGPAEENKDQQLSEPGLGETSTLETHGIHPIQANQRDTRMTADDNDHDNLYESISVATFHPHATSSFTLHNPSISHSQVPFSHILMEMGTSTQHQPMLSNSSGYTSRSPVNFWSTSGSIGPPPLILLSTITFSQLEQSISPAGGILLLQVPPSSTSSVSSIPPLALLAPLSSTSSGSFHPAAAPKGGSNMTEDNAESKIATKHMRIDAAAHAKELRACERHDQHEHDMWLALANHTHSESMAAFKTKNLELTVELERLKIC